MLIPTTYWAGLHYFILSLYTGKFQADYPRVFWMTKKSNGYYTIKGT